MYRFCFYVYFEGTLTELETKWKQLQESSDTKYIVFDKDNTLTGIFL